MRLENVLDEIHVSLTRRWWTQLFTAFTRCLLALAFIPPSIPKILHKPFTTLPDSNAVGQYFNALMATGFYYEFIGWSQIIAAILLLIPRTSHILMAFAALYLTAWEYDRLKPIVFATRKEKPGVSGRQWLFIPAFFAVGGIVMAVLWWAIGLGNFPNYLTIGGGLCVLGLVFGIVVTIHYRFMPVGHLSYGPRKR